jgi:hypothetical protein
MKSIRFTDGEDNIGGIYSKLFIVPAILVDEFPDADIEDNHSIDAGGITFTDSDTMWYELDCTQETALLTEESKETDDGKLFTYKIECVIPKNTEEKWNNLKEMQRYEHIVVAQDNNGQKRIVGYVDGTEKHGMTMDAKFTSGKATKDKNSFTLNFIFETYREALPVIFNEELVAIEGQTPTS